MGLVLKLLIVKGADQLAQLMTKDRVYLTAINDTARPITDARAGSKWITVKDRITAKGTYYGLNGQ